MTITIILLFLTVGVFAASHIMHSRFHDQAKLELIDVAKEQLALIIALRHRVESLERAQGLTPGTSMHTGWKEGSE